MERVGPLAPHQLQTPLNLPSVGSTVGSTSGSQSNGQRLRMISVVMVGSLDEVSDGEAGDGRSDLALAMMHAAFHKALRFQINADAAVTDAGAFDPAAG